MKQSLFEKSIASIDYDIAVLQAAKARLVQQRDAKPAKKPHVVKPASEQKAG